mmetsp:Transcript_24155/g.69512  ORF Transcript_24155/g.69512 Transcript_24155/m.69512 type:complete len:228 (-) Transcript_24155:324-1007(-)
MEPGAAGRYIAAAFSTAPLQDFRRHRQHHTERGYWHADLIAETLRQAVVGQLRRCGHPGGHHGHRGQVVAWGAWTPHEEADSYLVHQEAAAVRTGHRAHRGQPYMEPPVCALHDLCSFRRRLQVDGHRQAGGQHLQRVRHVVLDLFRRGDHPEVHRAVGLLSRLLLCAGLRGHSVTGPRLILGLRHVAGGRCGRPGRPGPQRAHRQSRRVIGARRSGAPLGPRLEAV